MEFTEYRAQEGRSQSSSSSSDAVSDEISNFRHEIYQVSSINKDNETITRSLGDISDPKCYEGRKPLEGPSFVNVTQSLPLPSDLYAYSSKRQPSSEPKESKLFRPIQVRGANESSLPEGIEEGEELEQNVSPAIEPEEPRCTSRSTTSFDEWVVIPIAAQDKNDGLLATMYVVPDLPRYVLNRCQAACVTGYSPIGCKRSDEPIYTFYNSFVCSYNVRVPKV